MNFSTGGHGYSRPLLIPEDKLKKMFPDLFRKERKGRLTDRQRREDARIALASMPGNVSHYTRPEAAVILACSIRTVQRYEDEGKLVPRRQHGDEVTYEARDVRRLAPALRKEN